jgi:hypothetical protein
MPAEKPLPFTIKKVTASVGEKETLVNFWLTNDQYKLWLDQITWRGQRELTEFSPEADALIKESLSALINLINELKRTGRAY